jgi:hypothetical protein
MATQRAVDEADIRRRVNELVEAIRTSSPTKVAFLPFHPNASVSS